MYRILLLLGVLVAGLMTTADAGALTPPPIGSGPPRFAPQDQVLLRAGGLCFVPLGAALTRTGVTSGGATLTGHCYSEYGTPWPGATVTWSAPVGTTPAEGSTTADADGAYTFTGLPAASANGTLMMSAVGDPLWDATYVLARTRASWPGTGVTTVDFVPRGCGTRIYPGGPWSDWETASLWLYGSDGAAELVCKTKLDGSGGTYADGSIRPTADALTGRYDGGALYWWANEGQELTTPVLVSPTDEYIYASDFVGADRGWMVTSRTDFYTPVPLIRASVLRTTNGGLGWSTVEVLTGDQLTGIDFLDADIGWVCGTGGKIATSSDGGASWTAQSSGTAVDLHGIAFTDALHGWAVGGGGTMLVTQNGGASWLPRDLSLTTDLLDVAFSDALHGWAVGDQGVVLATTDGGATWTAQSSTIGLPIVSVASVDGIHACAIGSGSGSSAVLYTANGGQTWMVSDLTQIPYAQPYTVAFSSDMTAWLALGREGVAKSIDGGATWTMKRPLRDYYDSSSEYLTLSCAGPAGLWAAGSNGGMSASRDGGETWTSSMVTAREADAQRFTAASPLGASGNPGSTVKLRLVHYRKGAVTLLAGTPEYPASAPTRSLGSYTSKGGAAETKSVTLPSTTKPGYRYWFTARNKYGVLVLQAPFQVSLLRASARTITRGQALRLSGVVPVKGHVGSTPGRAKTVAVYRSVTSATKGFKYVKSGRANGYGKFVFRGLKPPRTSWYTVVYAGDGDYWQDATTAVKVTVR